MPALQRRALAAIHFLTGFAALGLGAPESATGQTLPANFVREQVHQYQVAGDPTGFAFLPDGRILVIVRSQATVRISAVGSTNSVLLFTVPNVVSTGFEQGLLGVAVDPGWPARPYVYFCYTHTAGGVRVTMYTASGDLTNPSSTNLTFATPYHVITSIPSVVDYHNSGTLRFGPDGMLYVSTGDDGNQCGAQDIAQLEGKILRMTVANVPAGGTGPPPLADLIPAGNPFSGPNDIARLVYAWGLRNPFRFTIDPATNDLFIGDVGENLQEEVDVLPASEAGLNFGWPQREGLADHPCCGGCGLSNTFTDPVYAYPHSGLGNSVIMGPRMRFVSEQANSFPASYDGSVFVTDFYDGWIRRLVPSGGGWALAPAVPGQPSTSNWGEGFGFLTDLQMGADGALYYCLWTGGFNRGVWRIRPEGGVTDAPATASAAMGGTLRVSPNPAGAGSRARIAYECGGGAGALDLLDARGRVLRTWDVTQGAGSLDWDGAAADGRTLPAGVYFVRLREGSRTQESAKVTILR